MTQSGNRIGLVGFGLIGASWAMAFLRKGFEVCIHDPSMTQERLDAEFLPAASKVVNAADIAGKLRIVADIDDLSACDYLQESIREDAKSKQDLFAVLDRIMPGHVVIGSSTSALRMSDLVSDLPGRDRFVVAHPASPPHALPVVEIVPAPFTADWAVARTEDLLKEIGQTPVTLLREVPGFAMNRLQGRLLLSMLELVRDKVVTPQGADALIRDGFGLRWALLGPFEGVHLNAPGGISDYFERYAPMFDRFCPEGQSLRDVLCPETLAALEEYCLAKAPLVDAERHRNARDEALLGLREWRAEAVQ